MTNIVNTQNYKEKKYTILHTIENQGIRFKVKIAGMDVIFYDDFDDKFMFNSHGIGNKPVFGKTGEFYPDQFLMNINIPGVQSEGSAEEKTRHVFDYFDQLLVDYCIEKQKTVKEMQTYFKIGPKTKPEIIPEMIAGFLKSSFRPSEMAIKKATVNPTLNLTMNVGQFGTGPVKTEVKADKSFSCVRGTEKIYKESEVLGWKYIYSSKDEQFKWLVIPTIVWEGGFLNGTNLSPAHKCARVWVMPDSSNTMTDVEKEREKRRTKQAKIENATKDLSETEQDTK